MAGAEKKAPRGVRGRVVKRKKEDMADYMADAVALVKEYVPPDPARIQAVKDAGKLSVNPLASVSRSPSTQRYSASSPSSTPAWRAKPSKAG